ncbi:cob(I)yrinic acid a,c-diamide adenosyltransferase [bacterium]|nr:MAG: cob(I)yrinic acid a,c-diamide adenosyltransferase [bacterium]RKZ18100.1 MAG: cob(I)yrinic acid a,c-diamide adenosyltransferase [bacterium]
MVRLNRIYTKTGDDGSTGLADGTRRSKSDTRLDSYGTVDELNATVGLAINAVSGSHPQLADLLASIQHDLFDLGADLSTPGTGDALRITAAQVKALEAAIDTHNADLPALESFILPGGSDGAASLHLARTVCRRAERVAVHLAEHEGVNPEAIHYLNRLSDLLFVLARVANSGGKADVLWVPGKNRS